MPNIEIKFHPSQIVQIKDLENGRGLVSQVVISTRSIEYEVRYWHNGEHKVAWLLAEQLQEV